MSDHARDTALSRLEREREQAERRYVAALAALDAAAEPPPEVSATSAAVDADRARLNQVWQKYAPAPGDRSTSRLAARIVAELARLLPWRRRALNGALVAAVNRQADATRALADASYRFQSHVVWYAQTVAAFAAAPRRGLGDGTDVKVLHAALDSLASDWLKHWDGLQSREHRYEARMAALTRAYEELRTVATLAEQGTLSLKRTVESIAASGTGVAAPASASAAGTTVTGPALDAYKYVAFEDHFRGSRDEIRARLQDYVPLFAGATGVVDLGCGRGELLDLFREQGIGAAGVDLNDDMVASCQARGLTAERGDALAYLAGQPDASLSGVIAIQVVEHLDPPYLMRLIETARHKLRPGKPMVLETINTACWAAFFDSYIRDFTHVRPVHPETLKYLVQASGFSSVDLQFRSPIADHDKLPTVRFVSPQTGPGADMTLVDLVEAVNAHAERLNARLFTHRDFAIIARA